MSNVVEEFIGRKIPTPKGGVLTVLEISKGQESISKSAQKFILECTICSLDTELWRYGDIQGRKSALENGRIPCGCTNTKWTERQACIRVARECSKRGYIFHGLVGSYSGNTTKLDLENPVTGNRWNSTQMNNFFNGRGDPAVGKERSRIGRTISDDIHIQDFIRAGFSEDYVFWRSDRVDNNGLKSYWNYTCPFCSEDEYVKVKLCTGIFESYTGNLKSGVKSCRCGNRFYWTQEQRKYQLLKICEAEGLSFLGWAQGNYKNNKSRFKWVCHEGHRCNSSVSDFLDSGTRCRYCRDTTRKQVGVGYGYFPHRVTETDNLYAILFKKDKLIKIGRAFDVQERLFKQSSCLLKLSKHNLEDIKVLSILTGTHQEIFNLEQELHEDLSERGFHVPLNWTQEAFSSDCEYTLKKLLSMVDYPVDTYSVNSINNLSKGLIISKV